MLKVADLFCGCGGASHGMELSGAMRIEFAVDCWPVAVRTHRENFSKARHVCSKLHRCSPSECAAIDVLFASPECTHHSLARGALPLSEIHRSGAWEILPWIEFHRPQWVIVENVPNFKTWGPLDCSGRPDANGKGRIFEAWLAAIKSIGYRVEHAVLNAANFGAATSRRRLFVVARSGQKSIPWPEETHEKSTGSALPGLEKKPWRAASEIIDWGIRMSPITGRKKPLSERTLLSINKGIAKYADTESPVHWLMHYYHDMPISPVDEPLDTITTTQRHAIVRASRGRDIGGVDIRMLSVKELAAAQGFAEWFTFCGSNRDVVIQIGNSVSPPVAAAIARKIAAA